jgi:hypothetical protein
MIETLFYLIASLRYQFRDRRELALENLALRQQLAILARIHPRRRLRKTDRLPRNCSCLLCLLNELQI